MGEEDWGGGVSFLQARKAKPTQITVSRISEILNL
jgi:hypothetical protein